MAITTKPRALLDHCHAAMPYMGIALFGYCHTVYMAISNTARVVICFHIYKFFLTSQRNVNHQFQIHYIKDYTINTA